MLHLPSVSSSYSPTSTKPHGLIEKLSWYLLCTFGEDMTGATMSSHVLTAGSKCFGVWEVTTFYKADNPCAKLFP